MTSYSKGDVSATFTYDADGLRGSKTVNGSKTTYFYVGDQLMYECRGDGIELYFYYDSYGNLSAIRYVNGTNSYYYYVTTNSQGDVLGIYSATGDLKASYEYDTWGNCTIVSDTSGINIATVNPIRYRGYYYDNDLGLYYLQSRYYDSTIGRFLNADGYVTTNTTEPLAYNMFAYCGNNPVNRADPTGHFWRLLLGVGIVIVGVLTLGGCSKPDDYRENNTNSQNCYTYAFDIEGYAAPGDYSAGPNNPRLEDDKIYTTEEMTDLVLRDMEYLGKDVRTVSSPYDKKDDEIIVAMNINKPPCGEKFDYHFAVQLSNGKWADKVGFTEAQYDRIDGNAIEWEINEYQVYDVGPVYFAVGN